MSCRIGISGGPGTGKTSLARRLSARAGLPLVSEGVRERLAVLGEEVPHHMDLQRQVDLQIWFLRHKRCEESARSAFVSDRTVLDGLVICAMRLGSVALVGELGEEARLAWTHAAQSYELVVLPPEHFWPDEGDRVRYEDQAARGVEHREIGRLVELLGVHVLRLRSGTPDERMEEVLGWYGAGRRAAPALWEEVSRVLKAIPMLD